MTRSPNYLKIYQKLVNKLYKVPNPIFIKIQKFHQKLTKTDKNVFTSAKNRGILGIMEGSSNSPGSYKVNPRDPTPKPIKAGDLDFLIVEAQRLGESAEKHTQRIFTQGSMGAAKTIVNLAMACGNDTVRLKAAQYVVDRTLGPIRDVKLTEIDANDPWQKLAAECVSDMPHEDYDRLRSSMQEAHDNPNVVREPSDFNDTKTLEEED